jgi:hypothetical protein
LADVVLAGVVLADVVLRVVFAGLAADVVALAPAAFAVDPAALTAGA